MNDTRFSLPGLRLHWSVLPIALLVIWELASGVLPVAAPGYSAAAYWLMASVAAAGFFAALLAHELAHAVVARRHGQRVRGITLWLFGGVAELDGDAASPAAEFRTAVVGPVASLGVAAVSGGLSWLAAKAGSGPLLVAGLAWLGRINVLLAAFNLLPAFPLDGGRVLRAALWRWSGNRGKATVWAAQAGRVQGGAIVGLGVAGLLFFGWGISGLWLAVIGLFIVSAAGQHLQLAQAGTGPPGLTAGDLVAAPPVAAPDRVSVAGLVDWWVRPHRLVLCPLVDAAGLVTGVVTAEAIRHLPHRAWPLTAAGQIAVPLTDVVACRPGDPLAAVAGRLAGSGLAAALVFDGAHLVGILTTDDIRNAAVWGSASPSPAGPSPTTQHPAGQHRQPGPALES